MSEEKKSSKIREPIYKLLSSEFIASADSPSCLPTFVLPEVAFVGRSNVGKSSLVNAILERKKLARVGKTPGATKVFCFYEVRFRETSVIRGAEDSPNIGLRKGMIVDLPGYGYAKVSDKKRQEWLALISHYLSKRSQLQAVVLLLDCRRELADEERDIISMGSEGGLILCLTKSDKASNNDLQKRKSQLIKETGLPAQSIIAVSTIGKDAFRRQQELRDCILSYLASVPEVESE